MKDVNLSSLTDHPRIEHLYIENSNIQDFDFLFTMPALNLLELSYSTIPQEKEDELTKKGITVINNS